MQNTSPISASLPLSRTRKIVGTIALLATIVAAIALAILFQNPDLQKIMLATAIAGGVTLIIGVASFWPKIKQIFCCCGNSRANNQAVLQPPVPDQPSREERVALNDPTRSLTPPPVVAQADNVGGNALPPLPPPAPVPTEAEIRQKQFEKKGIRNLLFALKELDNDVSSLILDAKANVNTARSRGASNRTQEMIVNACANRLMDIEDEFNELKRELNIRESSLVQEVGTENNINVSKLINQNIKARMESFIWSTMSPPQPVAAVNRNEQLSHTQAPLHQSVDSSQALSKRDALFLNNLRGNLERLIKQIQELPLDGDGISTKSLYKDLFYGECQATPNYVNAHPSVKEACRQAISAINKAIYAQAMSLRANPTSQPLNLPPQPTTTSLTTHAAPPTVSLSQPLNPPLPSPIQTNAQILHLQQKERATRLLLEHIAPLNAARLKLINDAHKEFEDAIRNRESERDLHRIIDEYIPTLEENRRKFTQYKEEFLALCNEALSNEITAEGINVSELITQYPAEAIASLRARSRARIHELFS